MGDPGGSWLTQLSPQVQNFGCYLVRNVTLHMALPALGYRHTTFLSVTRVLADNVSPSPELGVLWGPCTPPGAKPSSSPPTQATCMLRTPPKEPRQWGTAMVVPVHPDDLLHVDRLVSITVIPTLPKLQFGGGWGGGGVCVSPATSPNIFFPIGLQQRLVPGAELPAGPAGPWWGDLYPHPPHHPQRLLPWGEEGRGQ